MRLGFRGCFEVIGVVCGVLFLFWLWCVGSFGKVEVEISNMRIFCFFFCSDKWRDIVGG